MDLKSERDTEQEKVYEGEKGKKSERSEQRAKRSFLFKALLVGGLLVAVAMGGLLQEAEWRFLEQKMETLDLSRVFPGLIDHVKKAGMPESQNERQQQAKQKDKTGAGQVLEPYPVAVNRCLDISRTVAISDGYEDYPSGRVLWFSVQADTQNNCGSQVSHVGYNMEYQMDCPVGSDNPEMNTVSIPPFWGPDLLSNEHRSTTSEKKIAECVRKNNEGEIFGVVPPLSVEVTVFASGFDAKGNEVQSQDIHLKMSP
jgi:hypothetical protein